MFTVDTGNCILHARLEGSENGPAIMFANSLGTDLRVWDPLLPHLPSGLRLLRYDKRGHGLSDCPTGPYDIDTLVNDAAAVADAAGIRNATFVGLSIGGLIGQGLAQARPDIVSALVLMDTAAKIGTTQMWEDRIAALRAGGIGGMADAILDRWFAPQFRQDAAALAPWRHMLTRTPLDGYIACCQAIMGADFSASAGARKFSVTAVVGDVDQSTPPALVNETARLYGAPCHLIAAAGHLPCVEQPREVARILTQFIEENSHV